MRQRDDRRVAVGPEFDDGVVGHRAHQLGAGHEPAVGVLLARIADRHRVVERQRHLRDVMRELAGADHQQPPARAERGDEPRVVAVEHVGAVAFGRA